MEEGFPVFCEAFDDMGYDRDTKAFLLKKNEFPYEWLDSYDKLLWPVETMPLKSPVDFAKLRVSTVQEYLLIYLLCDGTQLADVFESFCNHIKGTHKNSTLSSSMVLPASPTMPCSTNSKMPMSTLSC